MSGPASALRRLAVELHIDGELVATQVDLTPGEVTTNLHHVTFRRHTGDLITLHVKAELTELPADE